MVLMGTSVEGIPPAEHEREASDSLSFIAKVIALHDLFREREALVALEEGGNVSGSMVEGGGEGGTEGGAGGGAEGGGDQLRRKSGRRQRRRVAQWKQRREAEAGMEANAVQAAVDEAAAAKEAALHEAVAAKVMAADERGHGRRDHAGAQKAERERHRQEVIEPRRAARREARKAKVEACVRRIVRSAEAAEMRREEAEAASASRAAKQVDRVEMLAQARARQADKARRAAERAREKEERAREEAIWEALVPEVWERELLREDEVVRMRVRLQRMGYWSAGEVTQRGMREPSSGQRVEDGSDEEG